MSPVVQGSSLGAEFALLLESFFFFSRTTFACFMYSQYKMVVTMVTKINETCAGADCSKGGLCITFSVTLELPP